MIWISIHPLAKEGRYLHGGDGIIADDMEITLANIGRLSTEEMNTTDKVIIGL